jgi:hypothetical protein
LDATFKPLDSNTGFLLDLNGHKAVAMKLSNGVAKEITGHSTSTGVLARLKAVFGGAPGDQWLILTNSQNPLLKDYDSFSALVAKQLTTAIGTEVPTKKLIISGSIPITKTEQRMGPAVGP